MISTAFDRFGRWLGQPDADASVRVFRRVFAAIWLLYDLVDLAWGMTERSRSWFPHPREGGLVALQLVLAGSGAMLLLGRGVWVSGIAAAMARAAEARVFFPLNDFYFGSIVYLLLAHSEGGPLSARRPNRAPGGRPTPGPKWVHDALLVQFAWIYFATAALKLNPDWLGGGHLFVRTQYLALSQGWPYPAWMAGALSRLGLDAALAAAAASAELALGLVLLLRGDYRLGVGLAAAIHVVGALLTNVWFFSASMIAGVVLLLPRKRRLRAP